MACASNRIQTTLDRWLLPKGVLEEKEVMMGPVATMSESFI